MQFYNINKVHLNSNSLKTTEASDIVKINVRDVLKYVRCFGEGGEVKILLYYMIGETSHDISVQ